MNTFPLPRRLFAEVLHRPEWETVLLRLRGGPAEPVAFGVQYVGDGYLCPLVAGLDYDYLEEGCYRRLLLQTIRDAQRHGARRVLMGMGADLEKRRFGAHPERRFAYIAVTDTYNAEVLAQLTESLGAA